MKPTDVDLHCLQFSIWIQIINNLNQAIWLADNLKRAWHLNLFSRTRANLYRFFPENKIWHFMQIVSIGVQVDTFILDFKKAFDTPSRELKNKLFGYGSDGKTLRCKVGKMLSNMSIFHANSINWQILVDWIDHSETGMPFQIQLLPLLKMQRTVWLGLPFWWELGTNSSYRRSWWMNVN